MKTALSPSFHFLSAIIHPSPWLLFQPLRSSLFALLWIPHHLSCHGESGAIPFLSLVCLPCVGQDQSHCPRKGQEAEPNTKDVSFRETSREKGQNQENQCLCANVYGLKALNALCHLIFMINLWSNAIPSHGEPLRWELPAKVPLARAQNSLSGYGFNCLKDSVIDSTWYLHLLHCCCLQRM